MAEVSPLSMMLAAMGERWFDGEEGKAIALAKLAAPYLHARALSVRAGGDVAGVSDEELEQ